MKAIGKVLLALSLLAAVPAGLAAQQKVTLDLTDGGGSQSVSPGKFVIDIVNRVPNAIYTVNVKIQEVAIPSFTLSGLGITAPQPLPVPAEAQKARLTPPERCDLAVNQIKTDLANAQTEQEVKKAIADVRSSSDYAKCDQKSRIDDEVIGRLTVQEIKDIQLNQGEELVVDVQRDDPVGGDGSKQKKWTFTLTTGAKGAWLVHYGFSFLKDHDRTYFAKADDPTTDANGKPNPTTYHITRKSDHSGLKAEPSVVLSYVPARFRSRDYFPALTAGLGVDLNNPFVFFGGSFLVGDNVNVFLGAAVHREKRLNGKYHENDPLKENLSEDQLTDNVLKPALVFGVGFRFDTNPFKKSSGSDTSGKGSEAKK